MDGLFEHLRVHCEGVEWKTSGHDNAFGLGGADLRGRTI